MFRWTRVQILSDDERQAVAPVGAGRNFLNDHFRIPSGSSLEQAHLNQWLERAIAELKTEITEIESGAVYYKVYANTAEGEANGLNFLREEVSP